MLAGTAPNLKRLTDLVSRKSDAEAELRIVISVQGDLMINRRKLNDFKYVRGP